MKLNIGKSIIDDDHVVRIDRLDAETEHRLDDGFWDGSRHYITVPAKPAGVCLTLTSIEEAETGQVSVSQTITIRGGVAEQVWRWFCIRADNAADVKLPEQPVNDPIDPFAGPGGERVRQELLAEARAEGRGR